MPERLSYPQHAKRQYGCHPIDLLTLRERDIVGMTALGRTSQEIARLFRISHEAARSHRRNAYAKLRPYRRLGAAPSIPAALLYYDWAMRNPGYDRGLPCRT